MNCFSFILLPLLYIKTEAHVKAKLVYPIIPIEDNCHFVFDDTTSTYVLSKKEFLQLNKL